MRKEILLGRHRTVIALAVILLASFIIFKTRLVESFMSLVFAGVVPGTDIVLSPDMMLLLAASAIWLLFGMLIIRWVILRNHRGRHAAWKHISVRRESAAQTVGKHVVEVADMRRGHPQSTPAQPVALAVQNTPTTKVKQSKRPVVRQAIKRSGNGLRLAANSLAGLTVTAAMRLSRAVAILGDSLKTGYTYGKKHLKAASIGAGRHTAAFARSAGRTSKTGWRRTMQGASDIWRWAEPRLWKIDAWLEIQVRRFETWATKSSKRSPQLAIWRLQYAAKKHALSAIFAKPAPVTKAAPIKSPKSDTIPKR